MQIAFIDEKGRHIESNHLSKYLKKVKSTIMLLLSAFGRIWYLNLL